MTLLTLATAQSRILTLPDRPPFMLASALAEFYEVEPKRIGAAVKRNPDRFPEDFVFEPSETEAGLIWEKWTQNATTSQGSRSDLRPLAFTEAGALALSGVLKSARAAEVSVIVHRAFAQILAVQRQVRLNSGTRIRLEMLSRNPLWVKLETFVNEGWPFERIARACNQPRWKVARGIDDMVRIGMLSRTPAGMPDPATLADWLLRREGPIAANDVLPGRNQLDMFGEG